MTYSRVTFRFVSGLAKIISNIICALNFKNFHFYTHLYMHVWRSYMVWILEIEPGHWTQQKVSLPTEPSFWPHELKSFHRLPKLVFTWIWCSFISLCFFSALPLCYGALPYRPDDLTGVRIRWMHCFLSSLEASVCVWQRCRQFGCVFIYSYALRGS